ncbi:hypothetical protein BDE27_3317 [Xenorhabdus ehlersii]|uniref:Uncharacterized protein n=1 Tax=Xenorhabdus ehlersii TaxID=290111 RepID=A0A2D0IL20_9GAMM|nr:hypothetical protein [Xenorhabdus sp. TS4]PHM22498.1 hypothetical protein Xehl_03646 [Xenorhabdus ehlersii]RKE88673.1 hypothetical protein BDE27_3317 [Xenorhabdus ehlersii]
MLRKQAAIISIWIIPPVLLANKAHKFINIHAIHPNDE